MVKKWFIFLLWCSVFLAPKRLLSQSWEELEKTSWVRSLSLNPIKINARGGIASQVHINENNKNEYIIGFDNAGLYLTYNAGETFEYLLPKHINPNLQGIGVDWSEKTIWIVTPDGVFFSDNLGKTWRETAPLKLGGKCKVLIFSREEIAIASQGDGVKQMGFFKTKNRGALWEQTFAHVGVSSVVRADKTSNTLYMSSWDYTLKSGELVPYGEKSAIYKSENAGDSWIPITLPQSGMPRAMIGRILLYTPEKGLLFALVDNRMPNKDRYEKWENITGKEFLLLSDKVINRELRAYSLEGRYNANILRELVEKKSILPKELMNYCKGKTPVIGEELYYTINEGETWERAMSLSLKNEVSYNETQQDTIIINEVAKRVLKINQRDSIELSVNNELLHLKENENLLDLVEEANDRGRKAYQINHQGDFTLLENKYLNDSILLPDVLKINHMVSSLGKTPKLWISTEGEGQWLYQRNEMSKISEMQGNIILIGGKEMLHQSFGKLIDIGSGREYEIEEVSSTQIRNKNMSVSVSPHNANILYSAGSSILQSVNRGKNWSSISPELLKKKNSIHLKEDFFTEVIESPLQLGLLYSGGTDGSVWISTNAGGEWKRIYFPEKQQERVFKIIPSMHQRERVYVVLHSSDGTPLLLKSENMGKNWEKAQGNLPFGSINTLVEDRQIEQLLFVGGQSGLWVSFDGAESYHALSNGLKRGGINAIAYLDENNLAIGTEGQGLFSVDVTSLRELRIAVQQQVCYPLFEQYVVGGSDDWGKLSSVSKENNKALCYISTFAKEGGASITLRIVKDGVSLCSYNFITERGFNYLPCSLEIGEPQVKIYNKRKGKGFFSKAEDGKYYLSKGSYRLILEGEMFDEERLLLIE